MINIELAHTCERSIRVVTVYLLYDAYRADVIFVKLFLSQDYRILFRFALIIQALMKMKQSCLILKWYDGKAVYKKYTAFF